MTLAVEEMVRADKRTIGERMADLAVIADAVALTSPTAKTEPRKQQTQSTKALVQVDPDHGIGGKIGGTLIFLLFVSPMLQQGWWLAPAGAALFWVVRLGLDLILNFLEEPIVRLSTTNVQPGEDLIVECELRAKTSARVRDVVVGFLSYESYGEESHTERYGSWSMARGYDLGKEPAAVRFTVQPPTSVVRKWSSSSMNWYLALKVDVEGTRSVRRRYPIEY